MGEIEEFKPVHEPTLAEQKLNNSDGIKPAWQPLRDEMFARLQSERPNCDTITLMTMERLSFIFTNMKQMEASGVSVGDQKEFMKMYNELVSSLTKIDEKQQAMENLRIEATQMMVDLVKNATEGLPKAQQQQVMSRLLNA